MMYAVAALAVLITMGLALARALIGPTVYDRILAVNMFGTKTVLLIAHRLSTIEQADRIIVLEQGELAEAGTREELIAQGGIYAGMLKTKHDIEEAAVAAV